MFIDRAIELHRLKIEPVLGRPIGAFKTDIIALEARIHSDFPEAYREYLLWIGADFNGVLRGSDCFISHVEENHEGLKVLFKENDLNELPCCPIVFFMHQGYSACWFEASDRSDDPVVFCFSESESASGIQSVGTFSEWLYGEILGLSEAMR